MRIRVIRANSTEAFHLAGRHPGQRLRWASSTELVQFIRVESADAWGVAWCRT